MALFDFLKNIFDEQNKKTEETVKKEILIDGLPLLLENELKNFKDKQTNFKGEIIIKIEKLKLDIEQQVIILNALNIDKKREHEKIKFIVKENLQLYAEYLKKLAIDLDNIKDVAGEDYFKKLYESANNFDKLSRRAFEKATILVGKELSFANEIARNFFKDLDRKFNENKIVLNSINNINKIKYFLDDFNRIRQHENEIDTAVKTLDNKLIEINNRISQLKNKISDIKESKQYNLDLEIKEKSRLELKKLEREIQLLKEKMLLKDLSKRFHSDEKKSKLIKEYLFNFDYALESDKNLCIIDIIREAGYTEINNLKELRERYFELKDPFITESDAQIRFFEAETERLNLELLGGEAQIIEDKKKKYRLITKKERLAEDIKKNAEILFPNIKIYY